MGISTKCGVLVAVMSLAGCPCAPRGAVDGLLGAPHRAPREGGVVDTHLHIAPSEMARTVAIMDEVGLSWGLNLSGGWPGGPLERQLAAALRSGRLVVACNLPWALAQRTEAFPSIAVDLLNQAHILGVRALKVEKALGLHARKPDGRLLAVDDPWLDPIWQAAGMLHLPVVIHVGDPRAFWLPVDAGNERQEELLAHPGWSNAGDPELPSFEDLLAALMRVVQRHRATTFVAVHFGNNAEDPEWVARMLDTHPNLYVDLAARLPEIGRPEHDPKLLRALFIRYADHILFGTDTGVSPDNFLMLGSFGLNPNQRNEVAPYFAAHWRWLETDDPEIPSPTPIQGHWKIRGLDLPTPVLVKIYRQNAERLFGPPPSGHPEPVPAALARFEIVESP